MAEEKPSTIEIHYQKNPMYRSVYADGAIGGITPTNKINLGFYATRKSIPKSITFELNQNGAISKPIAVSSESKEGIVREIEFNVYMDKSTAHELYLFLKKIFNENESK